MDLSTSEKAALLTEWLSEKKAEHIISIDVSDRCSFTEHLIVCTGTATLHNRAIADYIIEKAHQHKFRILGKEGLEASVWILIDLNDVIVHIFTEENRKLYKLEDLWTTKNINIEAITQSLEEERV